MKVFRIEAAATIKGITTAGSVPNTNSRITSAPIPPISVSTMMLGPPPPPLPAACSSAAWPVTEACTPLGAAFADRRLGASTVCPESKPLAPAG